MNRSGNVAKVSDQNPTVMDRIDKVQRDANGSRQKFVQNQIKDGRVERRPQLEKATCTFLVYVTSVS